MYAQGQYDAAPYMPHEGGGSRTNLGMNDNKSDVTVVIERIRPATGHADVLLSPTSPVAPGSYPQQQPHSQQPQYGQVLGSPISFPQVPVPVPAIHVGEHGRPPSSSVHAPQRVQTVVDMKLGLAAAVSAPVEPQHGQGSSSSRSAPAGPETLPTTSTQPPLVRRAAKGDKLQRISVSEHEEAPPPAYQ